MINYKIFLSFSSIATKRLSLKLLLCAFAMSFNGTSALATSKSWINDGGVKVYSNINDLHNKADREKVNFPVIRLFDTDTETFANNYSEALSEDPYEEVNRVMFDFNMTLDEYLLKPMAKGYRYAIPSWGRQRVSDFFGNLGEFNNWFNSVLQGDIEGGFRAFWRFAINSTFGVAGIYDVASEFGLHEKEKFFSQTLAYYGVPTGNYVVVPLLGPSTWRDLGGFVIDANNSLIPLLDDNLAEVGSNILEITAKRESLLDITDDLEFSSFDLYGSYKSIYIQNQQNNLVKYMR